MVHGISFSKGVFFHNNHILSCAEVRHGVIHVWAEKMTFRTLLKMWYRILFSMPWYYHLFHLFLFFYAWKPLYQEIDPLWLLVYFAGFHFVFPKQLKQFHGAEHKVFSYMGEKKPENIEGVRRASIVNSGCSTNSVTYFFAFFLMALLFIPLIWSIFVGFLGILLFSWKNTYVQRLGKPLRAISAFLQKYVTTKEPKNIHLETAIRSYALFQHYVHK